METDADSDPYATFDFRRPKPTIIFQRLKQTGDTPHVAAELALNKVLTPDEEETAVLVLFSNQTFLAGPDDYQPMPEAAILDDLKDLCKLYIKAAGNEERRVRTIGVQGLDIKQAIADLSTADKVLADKIAAIKALTDKPPADKKALDKANEERVAAEKIYAQRRDALNILTGQENIRILTGDGITLPLYWNHPELVPPKPEPSTTIPKPNTEPKKKPEGEVKKETKEQLLRKQIDVMISFGEGSNSNSGGGGNTSPKRVLERLNQSVGYEDPDVKHRYIPDDLGSSTRAVAWKLYKAKKEGVLSNIYAHLATRLSGSEFDPNVLFKDNKFGDTILPDPNTLTKPVLLLWSRYSGTNFRAGHNPDGDSSLKGQAQLIALFRDSFEIITIGHDPSPWRPAGPANADEMKASHAPCHLGEFYKVNPISGKGRGEQLSFMLALMQRYPGAIYQIGQKTGGMDAGALIGIPTVYIEHKGSFTNKRMQSWVNMVPHYRWAAIDKPPGSKDPKFDDTARRSFSQVTTVVKLDETKKDKTSDLYKDMMRLNQGTNQRENGMFSRWFYLKTHDGLPVPTIQEAYPIFKKLMENPDAADKEIAVLAQNAWTSPVADGYNKFSLITISEELSRLKDDYLKDTAIVRDAKGVYRPRSELPPK